MDARLAGREFVAGSRYTIADIIDAGAWSTSPAGLKLQVPEECANLRRWYAAVSGTAEREGARSAARRAAAPGLRLECRVTRSAAAPSAMSGTSLARHHLRDPPPMPSTKIARRGPSARSRPSMASSNRMRVGLIDGSYRPRSKFTSLTSSTIEASCGCSRRDSTARSIYVPLPSERRGGRMLHVYQDAGRMSMVAALQIACVR